MYLNKILPVLFSPIACVIWLTLAAVIFRKRRFAVAAILLLWAASLPILADRLFDIAQGQVTRSAASEMPIVDSVVVLAGGLGYSRGAAGAAPDWGRSVDRMFGGIELMRADRAARVVFSSWDRTPAGAETEGEYARRVAIGLGVEASRILLSPRASNTADEALLIRQMLPERGHRILLVTSAFHMPRAQRIFEEAGFVVTPFPVDLRLAIDQLWFERWLPDVAALEKTDIVVREWIGRAYYRVRFWMAS